MVVRNKWIALFDGYRAMIKEKGKNEQIKKGNRSKNRVLDFFLKHNRWPERKSEKVTERTLGYRFENYMSKAAPAFDEEFRTLVMLTGRVSNNKRNHDVAGFKKEILEFIEKHGRAPNRYRFAKIEGEGNLKAKLDYYTLKKNDMSFLGEVYALDKCHRSGIPMKFRRILNEQLEVEKPLVRMV